MRGPSCQLALNIKIRILKMLSHSSVTQYSCISLLRFAPTMFYISTRFTLTSLLQMWYFVWGHRAHIQLCPSRSMEVLHRPINVAIACKELNLLYKLLDITKRDVKSWPTHKSMIPDKEKCRQHHIPYSSSVIKDTHELVLMVQTQRWRYIFFYKSIYNNVLY